MLTAIAFTANAQRADCPKRDGSQTMTPPGKPPDFVPRVTAPRQWGGEVRIELPQPRPASDDLLDGEEAHVAGVAELAEIAQPSPPRPEVLGEMVDLQKTVLVGWQFKGYFPDRAPHRMTRVFTRDGSVLTVEQWNYAADGGSVYPMRASSAKVGRYPAIPGGIRGPSGCVSTGLAWFGDGTQFSLQMVGPLRLEEQRELLMQVAGSIDSVASRGK